MAEDEVIQTTVKAEAKKQKKEQAKTYSALAIGALLAVFAVLNFDDVKVNWIVSTGRSPLIVVIVASAAVGALADRLVLIRSHRNRNKD